MIMLCWKLSMNEIKSHALVSEVQVNISFKCQDHVNDEIYRVSQKNVLLAHLWVSDLGRGVFRGKK